MKKILSIVAVITILAGGYGFYKYRQATSNILTLTPDNIAKLEAQTAAQNESSYVTPAAVASPRKSPSSNNNVYFGDLHVHTSLSFDSFLFGNRNTIDDAYKFARGDSLTTIAGEKLEISRPLDFVALTDHAETFNIMDICMNGTELPSEMGKFCEGFHNPSFSFFMKVRNMGEGRPMQVPDFMCEMTQGDCEAELMEMSIPMWEHIKSKAEQYNDPGNFTTFSAYEYSPPLPKRGKHHRNVIFKGSETSRIAYSAFHARTAPILWEMLEQDCQDECEFLTIPHNLNKTWGLAYAEETIDGDAYSLQDWHRRIEYEPVAEMMQIKGASECATTALNNDEECGFEQFFAQCEEGENIDCMTNSSMWRDGLKIGMKIQERDGINPFQVGAIGATDNHNAIPGDTEEYDYRGGAGIFESPAIKRYDRETALLRNPGGLAAVWAPENTRSALFEAMQRKETYATSGNRISLRFFASEQFPENFSESEDKVALAYLSGVPMGSHVFQGSDSSAQFFVSASQDPMAAPLDRLQIIKGWIADGEMHEKVIDIACSDNRQPNQSGKCSELEAPVNLNNCAVAANKGAAQLATVWQDPNHDPNQNAFYYVRVLEIPSCRWSTYDALRLGQPVKEGYPASHRERAWSSPIWFTPAK